MPQNVWDQLGIQRPNPPQIRAAGSQWLNTAQQPFTAAWYADHPNAWHLTHPHADAAAVAAAASVAAWIAAPYANPYANTTTATSTTTAVAVPVDSAAVYGTADESVPGGDVAIDPTQWMTIGVFALKPTGQTEATRVVHLAVARNGTLGGTHYDLVSDSVQDVRGSVDKANLRMAWTVGEKGPVVFETPLEELSKPAARVTAHFPNGKNGPWQMVPVGQ
ncbi:MAG: hypothetical protein JXB62_23690 [Pirellulales bacterium]|nr:hypothetical protein [Pirellulales bacterium]